MGITKANSTDYLHPNESNLLELHRAMDYDKAGKPIIRVTDVATATEGQGQGAFGEVLTTSAVAVVQLDGLYGLTGDNADQFQQYSALGGVVDTDDNLMHVQASDTAFSYAVLRSSRFLRYRPGQGASSKFTARFTAGKTNTEQRAGLFNQEAAFMFGYNGDTFGILHSYGAKTHIAELAITVAPSASTDATIALNGTNFTVALVDGETVNETAARIARATFTGWIAQQVDNTVTFLSESVGPKSGAFTFTHGTATGTFTTKQSGVVATDVWYPQSQWSVDRCDGSLDTYRNASGMNIDPTKFQVFAIQYRWLGAGVIKFSLEDPVTGVMTLVHEIHWVNTQTTTTVGNPSMKVGYVAYNLGGGSVEVFGGSMAMFVEGLITQNDFPRAAIESSSSNLAQNVYHHITTIQNPITHSGRINTREIIIQDLDISVQSTDPVIALMFINANLATGNHVFTSLPESLAQQSISTGTFNIANNTAVIALSLSINGTKQFDLTKYRLVLAPGNQISVCLFSTNSISNHAVSLAWTVD